MNTLILRTITPILTSIMVIYSLFVLLRGHNDPGGGFIGGLIAASGFALYGIAFGVNSVRKAICLHPIVISAIGLIISTLSGLGAIFVNKPYLSSLWWLPDFGMDINFSLSSPLFFDIGVWMVVVGSITNIALALEEDN